MPIIRTFKCDVCGKEQIEPVPGYGVVGWGSLNGINFNGVDNPILCPDHKAQLADLMDKVRNDLG